MVSLIKYINLPKNNVQYYWSLHSKFIDSMDICATLDHSAIVFCNSWDGDIASVSLKEKVMPL